MAELVYTCPRCGAEQITFDVKIENYLGKQYDWQQWFEAFCVCRRCHKSTIFVVGQKHIDSSEIIRDHQLANYNGAINDYMRVERHISIADLAAHPSPDHLPDQIRAIFQEAAKCLAIGCWNASGTMFRLCVDLATQARLPDQDTPGLNANTRRNLGLRLPWMFENELLPGDLRDLSSCIREDGNDGAHAGTLVERDAEDMLDFSVALLERLYTQPEQLKIAEERRMNRRG